LRIRPILAKNNGSVLFCMAAGALPILILYALAFWQ
jgi:hypothetical protein